MIIEISFLKFTILTGFIFKICGLFPPDYVKVFMLKKKLVRNPFTLVDKPVLFFYVFFHVSSI